MNYYILIPLTGLLINLFLCGYIIGTGWENRATRALKLFCGGGMLWQIMDIIHWSGVSDQTALYVFKIFIPFVFVMPLIGMNIFYALAGRPLGYFFYFTAACIAIASILAVFTDLHIRETMIRTYWGLLPTPGPIYKPAVLTITVMPLLYTIFLTVKAIVVSKDPMLRKKLTSILTGFCIVWIISFNTLILLPFFFNIYDFPRVASASTAVISISIFISLVRYKFLAMSDSKIAYDLLSRITDGIILCDSFGRIVEINITALKILGLDAPPAKETNIWKLFPEKYDFNLEYHDFELVIEREGTERYLLLSQRIISMANYPIGTMIIIKDITDRRRDEERIKKSAIDKEILLRELQHRVKNNLNVIHSLLNFETGNLTSDTDREIFINAQNRIQAMGIVYDQLHATDEIELVRLDVYIDRLARDLIEIYSMKSRNIELGTDLAALKLDSQRAITLGLIVNELIMNSTKYAFPGARAGTITITLTNPGQWVVLEIRDNGVGISDENITTGIGTYGLRLINLLVQQISGYITIENASGMKVTVRFVR